jgi:putative peptidoglycan lipid II flippase
VLAEPIVRLLYQHGKFTPAQTPVVAGALAAFSAGLVFNGAMLMLNRAFFSLQSNWIPTVVAFGNLAVNAGLDAVFYRFGTWGIPLATSVANVAGTVALFVLLRRRLGRLELRETGDSVGRIVVASAVVGGVSFALWWAIDRALGDSFGGQLASVGTALVLGVVVYLFLCRALKVRELEALLALRGRFRPARP